MLSNKENQAIIKALADNENLISYLYKAYAQKFPKHKNFWERLSQDEIRHALILESLYSGIENHADVFNQDIFNLEDLGVLSEYIKREIYNTKNDMSLVSAAITAVDLENTLLEKNFLSVFASNLPVVQSVLEKLREETEKHLYYAEKFLEQAKEEK